ncbi:MAG: hypothetical protein ACK55I_17500 [bacterium]
MVNEGEGQESIEIIKLISPQSLKVSMMLLTLISTVMRLQLSKRSAVSQQPVEQLETRRAQQKKFDSLTNC